MSALTVDFAGGGALVALVVGVCGNDAPGTQSEATVIIA
jgi:hypothetical protein